MSTQAADTRPTWDAITYRHGRDDSAKLFIEAHDLGILRSEDYCRALADAWTGPDNPLDFADWDDWEGYFRAVGFLDEDKPGECSLTGVTTLYRGCTQNRLDGMSWSERPAVALSFAERYRRQGFDAHVWAADFEPETALARFTKSRPGEDEWVMETLGDDARSKARVYTWLG